MVKLAVFEIQLDRANEIYFPGEEVSGKVLLRTSEKQKINNIQIKFKGETYFNK
jgi:sporulation-control protein spo0M